MLKIKTRITVNEDITKASDLTDRFDDEDLRSIGEWAFTGYDRDEQSRAAWYRRTEYAMDLAMQVVKEKTFPWPGASNVKFPLVTIAAMQFHSRAYPAIIHGPEIVKYRVVGGDPTGEQTLRARRVGKHMSYQMMEQDSGWEEGMDRLLLNLPIVGCVFKKVYHSIRKEHNVSEVVLAKDLVVDYYAKSLEDAARVTHLIPYHRNDVIDKCLSGAWRDVTEEPWFQSASTYTPRAMEQITDNRKGQTPPVPDESTPFMFGEQHCLIDLDGDGYAEPYIVTFEMTSKAVVRIVARWEKMEAVKKNVRGRILRIEPTQYFTKYGFIPSPDNGIYDMGFGIILGPLNSSVDSLINILIDTGVMGVSAGGFLGRGVKMRGGKITFAPLEWQRVESTGDDLRKDIVPLPTREPSAVLFSLLSLLIDYSNRIPGTTDIMVGENVGQNTPAETARSMVEQGGKIYSSIFKRVWRCMKGETKMLYELNKRFMPLEVQFGAGQMITREDYQGNSDLIVPSADPTVTSEQARLQRAIAVRQAAYSAPGYDLEKVERDYLAAMNVEGIEMLYPGPGKVPPLPNPKMAVEEKKLEAKKMQIQADMQLRIAEMQEQRQLNAAKILELQAKAMKEIAEAGGVQTGHQIAAFEAAMGALKHNDTTMLKIIEMIQKGMKDESGSPSNEG
jgi:chaperonin GroES